MPENIEKNRIPGWYWGDDSWFQTIADLADIFFFSERIWYYMGRNGALILTHDILYTSTAIFASPHRQVYICP